MDAKDREKYLSLGKGQEDKLFLARVLDKIVLCQRSFEPQVTEFMDPYRQQLAEELLLQACGQAGQVDYLFSGGYPLAERQRLVLLPEFLAGTEVDPGIAVLEIKGNFTFQKVSHRDYLGSLLGLGIVRDRLGDILVGAGGAYVFADFEVAEYLTLHLSKVHRVPVKVETIKAAEVVLPEGQTREIRATVASLRLDCVASAGYGVSRSQMAGQIIGEKVKVNWRTIKEPSRSVGQGDMLSIRGKGRVEVVEIGGSTKKGRISLQLRRYL